MNKERRAPGFTVYQIWKREQSKIHEAGVILLKDAEIPEHQHTSDEEFYLVIWGVATYFEKTKGYKTFKKRKIKIGKLLFCPLEGSHYVKAYRGKCIIVYWKIRK